MSTSMADQLKKNLKSKRLSVKSVTAIVLFGAIILVFVFFGMSSRLGGGAAGSGFAGRVGNKLISIADVRAEAQKLEQYYGAFLGGQVSGAAQRQFIQGQALESLIGQEMMNQGAEKAGIAVSDAEVQNFIVSNIPEFQEGGQFKRDRYFELLKLNHLSPGDFEERIRKQIRMERTRQILEIGAQPTQIEVDKLKVLHDRQMNLNFAKFDRESVIKSMPISEAEVKAEMAQPDFAKRAQEFYEANKYQFNVEPQAHALHILIKSDGSAGSDAKALAKIKEIREKALKGDFAKLAKEYSEDVGSKVKGGDLGTFRKGQMLPEFETAAFSQKVGEVGEPIKTQYGYHIIKVLDRKDGGQKKFEDVKTDIAKQLVAMKAYDGDVKRLEEALAKNDSAGVDAALKKMGVKWEETGFFDGAVDVVPKLNSQEASNAAFSVTSSRPLFPKLVMDSSQRFVLKWKAEKHDPSTVKNISQSLERERMRDLMNAWAKQLSEVTKIERNPAVISGNY